MADQLAGNDLDYLEPLNPFKNLAFIELETEGSESDVVGAMPENVDIELAKVADLRYGENPHQNAALYRVYGDSGIANAEQLHGKEMSFNNYVDAEAAWRLVEDFDERLVESLESDISRRRGAWSPSGRLWRFHYRAWPMACDIFVEHGLMAGDRHSHKEVAH